MREASFWEAGTDGEVRCRLCPHGCRIRPGQRGRCGVRENRGGVLYSLVYGKVVAAAVDPIEKKPLFHLLPASRSLSIATVGCNLSCVHCQNADISQWPRHRDAVPGRDLAPEAVVRMAELEGCASISYTYTEPTVFFEFARDTARLAAERGLLNVFVTNAFINPEPLREVAPLLRAANVDLKSFREEHYRRVCGGRLQPVLDALRLMKSLGVWVEVTTLLIPTLNDSPEELRDIARFIRQELGPETPWHVTRFHPAWRLLDLPPTPLEALRRARRIGLEEGLRFVYTGNAPGEEGEHTRCPRCGATLIRRHGYHTAVVGLRAGRCRACGEPIEGVWEVAQPQATKVPRA